jgi:hypothetical protein
MRCHDQMMPVNRGKHLAQLWQQSGKVKVFVFCVALFHPQVCRGELWLLRGSGMIRARRKRSKKHAKKRSSGKEGTL